MAILRERTRTEGNSHAARLRARKQAQDPVENAGASKRASNPKVVPESIGVSLEETPTAPVVASPFADFRKHAGDVPPLTRPTYCRVSSMHCRGYPSTWP